MTSALHEYRCNCDPRNGGKGGRTGHIPAGFAQFQCRALGSESHMVVPGGWKPLRLQVEVLNRRLGVSEEAPVTISLLDYSNSRPKVIRIFPGISSWVKKKVLALGGKFSS